MNDSPDRRRVPLRALVRFLALFLVPVVVVAAPNVAQAATVYGTGVAFGVELSDVTSDSMTCVGVGQWVVPDSTGLLTPYVKFANIKCPLTFALGNQTSCDTDDCSEVVVEVEGEGCSASGSATILAGSSDVSSFAGPSLTLDPLCDVSSLCLTFNGYANNMPDMGTGRACVGWALGVAPAPSAAPAPSTCEHFDPTMVKAWTDRTFPNPPGYATPPGPYTVLHVEIIGTRKTAAAEMLAPWARVRQAGEGADKWLQLSPSSAMYFRSGGDGFSAYYGIAVDNAFTIKGVAFMSSPYSSSATPAQAALAHKRTADWGPTSSRRGENDPNNCLWYFGEKVLADNPSSTIDDPHGALMGADASAPDDGSAVGDDTAAAPPASDKVDESCTAGFSLWKPATWLSSGYCEIVSGLSTVARTLMGIPRAILGGLGGLFVPVDAPSWSDVPSPLPGGWVPSFDSLAAGGCAPLTMPQLDLGYAGSVGPTQMFDTCDDPWPLVRTFTYNGLLAMVLVGAIWQAYRAVATALGMNVQGGGGGGDDE